MSRIGNAPVTVPSGVEVTVAEGTITVKGFAKPVRTYRVTGIYDDLAESGRIIRHKGDALSLTIDRDKLKDGKRREAIEVLQSTLAELENGGK